MLSEAVKVSVLYVHVLTVVEKPSEVFFARHTHEYKPSLQIWVWFSRSLEPQLLSIDTLATSCCLSVVV